MSAFRIEWLGQYLGRAPEVIIDAGAFDCADSIAFKEHFPFARVIAFEACPDNFSRIMRRGVAEYSGVEVHHAAVGENDKAVIFNSCFDTDQDGHFGQSGSILAPSEKHFIRFPSVHFKPGRSVAGIRLDQFCFRENINSIDLLHMDVQGAEYFVLQGLGELRPKLIFLEIDETAEVGRYHSAIPEKDIKERLGMMGYAEKWRSKNDALYFHERN